MHPLSYFSSLRVFLLVFCFGLTLTAFGQIEREQPAQKELRCGYQDSELPPHVQQMMKQLRVEQPNARKAAEPLRECRVWIVVDSTMLAYYKGDTSRVKRELYYLYGQASEIMELQVGIRLNIVAIDILRRPTPQFNYVTRGVSNTKGQFENFMRAYRQRTDVNRDLAVLWTKNTGEPYYGVALRGDAYQHIADQTEIGRAHV